MITFLACENSFQPVYAVLPEYCTPLSLVKLGFEVKHTGHSGRPNINRPRELRVLFEESQSCRVPQDGVFLMGCCFLQLCELGRNEKRTNLWAVNILSRHDVLSFRSQHDSNTMALQPAQS